MDKQQRIFISLIKSALTGQVYSVPEDYPLIAASYYAKKSQISSMLYYGLLNCGVSPDLAPMQQLFMTTCAAAAIDEQQHYEFSKILQKFDEKNIKYMPMKGMLIKKVYPQSDMRSMCDLDILIDEGQYESIEPIMRELGYEEGVESDHELPWKKDRVYVELHKRMISTHNKDLYPYFGDGWKFARPVPEQPNRYEMSHEDVYIYLFTHLVKHYRSGGIGIKHFTDLWVYQNFYTDLDIGYIEAALEQLKLLEFYQNVMVTLKVWFEDAESTDITDLITYVVFKSGSFGNHDDHLAALVIRDTKTAHKKRNRFREITELFFPPYKKMCQKYNILKKAPILLPFAWIYRGFASFKGGTKRIKAVSKNIDVIATDKVTLYHQSLQKVGLDFHFGEQED